MEMVHHLDYCSIILPTQTSGRSCENLQNNHTRCIIFHLLSPHERMLSCKKIFQRFLEPLSKFIKIESCNYIKILALWTHTSEKLLPSWRSQRNRYLKSFSLSCNYPLQNKDAFKLKARQFSISPPLQQNIFILGLKVLLLHEPMREWMRFVTYGAIHRWWIWDFYLNIIMKCWRLPYIQIKNLQDKAKKKVACYQVLDKNINCWIWSVILVQHMWHTIPKHPETPITKHESTVPVGIENDKQHLQ